MYAQISPQRRPGWLATLLLVPFMIAAAVFGFVVFLAALGAVLLGALMLAARFWWLQRKLKRASTGRTTVLEGEYAVVREKARNEDKRLR